MPTASDELRKFAEINFGSIDSAGPAQALVRAGFTETNDYCWKRVRSPNEFEWNCINFLIQEWDWGGYVED